MTTDHAPPSRRRLFHQAVADRVGLHVTDVRCLNPLERADYVRRQVGPSDWRRLIIHPLPQRLAVIAPHYHGMATARSDLLGAYSDDRLALFLGLFDRMHQLSQRQPAGLPHHTPSDA